MSTDTPTEYADSDLAAAEAAIEDAMMEIGLDFGDDLDEGDPSDLYDYYDQPDHDPEALPTSIYVRADIEWSGESRGVRPSNFYNLKLAKVVTAAAVATAAKHRAASARPLASYRAKGYRAQVRQLRRTAAGRAALGTFSTGRTQAAWSRGVRGPSKASRDAIATAYDRARMRPVTSAQAALAAANKTLGKELNKALADAYDGQEIRLFDIHELRFNP